MRIRILLLLLILSSTYTFAENCNNIKIDLHVSSYINEIEQMVYVYYKPGNNFIITDSAKIHMGKNDYKLKCHRLDEGIITLTFSKRGPADLNILTGPNDHIKIEITKDDDNIGGYHKKLIKGNAYNDLLVDFWKTIYSFTRERQAIEDSMMIHGLDQQKMNELKEKHKTNKKHHTEYLINIAKTTPSPAIASTAQFITWGEIPRVEWDSLLSIIYKRFPLYAPIQNRYHKSKGEASKMTDESKRNYEFIQKVVRSRIALSVETMKKVPQIGDKINIQLVDSLGEKTSLNAFRGKYVLVELWASWCVPCIKEMPNIIMAQQKYKKDFICCALTVDKSDVMWKRRIKLNKLERLHHYKATTSDGRIYDDIKPLLNKGTVPQNYLLNREGEIIAINIYGEDLIKKLDIAIIK